MDLEVELGTQPGLYCPPPTSTLLLVGLRLCIKATPTLQYSHPVLI